MKPILTLVALLLTQPAALHAADNPRPSMPGPLAPVLQPFVDRQVIAGAVVIVADQDKILDLESIGFASLSPKAPMQTDSLFWLASMTKSFTGSALMMLVDEGKLNVDDPVEKYLPEFKGQQVADATDRTRRHPPQPPMTIKELLTHTSGIVGPNDPPIQRTCVLKEDVAQYAAAPLKWEPGTKYAYNNSGINTAGRIIEMVSGMSYAEFMQQRLLGPLGMKDTTFWPNHQQAQRLARTSQFNAGTSVLEDYTVRMDKGWLNQSSAGPKVPLSLRPYLGDALAVYAKHYAWPAGGLFSTARDVAKFCQMILNGGASQGKRYLSAEAVRRMTSNLTGNIVVSPQEACGLGWFVKLRSDEGPSVGSFGHRGARGPVMCVDPHHQLVMVLLIESCDIHLRGQPRGTEQRNLRAAVFRAAIEKYGKPTSR
jgi:CubicO group peptidase (beta-lactamase class C family)